MSIAISWGSAPSTETYSYSAIQTIANLLLFPNFFISVFLGIWAINAQPPRRTILMLVLILFAFLAFQGIPDITPMEMSSLFGFFILLWITHMINLLVLDDHISMEQASTLDWKSTYTILFDFRGYARGKRVLGPKHKERPRTQHFLLQRLLSNLAIVALYCMYIRASQPYLDLECADAAPSKQTFFRRIHTVTVRETFIRVCFVMDFVLSNWVYFTVIQSILAFVHVALEIGAPEDWVAVYGDIEQAYTIRRFWSRFWHRLVYRSYTALGRFVSQRVMRLRPGTLADRHCVDFIVFLLSGIAHAMVTMRLGFRCGYWEDIMFFCLNYAALLAEEVVQQAIAPLIEGYWPDVPLGKAVGFVWVFGFFFWSLPKRQYPKICCGVA